MDYFEIAGDDSFWEFVEDCRAGDKDFNRLRLKVGSDARLQFAVTQAELRHKHATKFRRLLQGNPRFIFPNTLAAEQASSCDAAAYHASLLGDDVRNVADLTSGLGVDSLACCASGCSVTAFDLKPDNCDALRANSRGQLITAMNCDSIEWLRNTDMVFDTIIIDPARRSADGKRLFSLADCQPDVVVNYNLIMSHCRRMIVKMSPMCDLTAMTRQLPGVAELHCIGTTTECKEVVAVVGRQSGPIAGPMLVGVTVSNGSKVVVTPAERVSSAVIARQVPEPGRVIYDPWPAVMKMQIADVLTNRWSVEQLAPSTHLFMAKDPVHCFPGRGYEVLEADTFDKRTIRRYENRRCRLNVTSRNFPLTAPEIVSRLKIREGGDDRLFAVTCIDRQLMLLRCRQLPEG